jgi:eukaryotic-like serine/threonine-protein kinase
LLRAGTTVGMAEPPREPPDPDDETIIVPPTEETVAADEWEPESEVFVEQTVTEPPRRRLPVIWPWLLALLVLVLAGLGAAYFLTRDDDDDAATTASTATTAPTTETTVASVRVPDVVGTTSSEATKTLGDAGFEVNVVAVPSDRPSGQVVAQSPSAGSEADEGSTVRLNVAQKAAATTTTETTATESTSTETSTEPTQTTPTPEPATVPDVVGKELADAARAFNDEGLKVAVAYVPSQEPRGQVVAQAKPAGTELKEGDTVQLNISTGPDPPEKTAVPDVSGTKQNPAREQLAAAGFEVLSLQQPTEDSSRVGSVLSQSPSGGASIPRGSLVLLYVGA